MGRFPGVASCLCLLAWPLSGLAQEALTPVLLGPGSAVEREIAAGQTHAYRLAPEAGSHPLVTVEQRGADVVVKVTGADGRSFAVDGPTGRWGPERLLLAAGAGPFRVDVEAPPGSDPGTYEIRLELLDDASSEDRQRLEAETISTESARLYTAGPAGSWHQAIALQLRALPLWRALGRQREEALALLNVARLHSKLGEIRESLVASRQELALWAGLGDERKRADTLLDIGSALRSLGEGKEGVAALQEAIGLFQALDDGAGEAGALNYICLIHHGQGELEEALACYERAAALFREAGKPQQEALVLVSTAGAYESLGEPRRALDLFDQVLMSLRAAGDKRGEAYALENIAKSQLTLGEIGESLAHHRQALAAFRELGDRWPEAGTLHNLGACYLALGELDRAGEHYEQALAIQKALGDRRGEAATLDDLGLIRQRLGEHRKARELYAQALELTRATGDRNQEAITLRLLGQASLALGEPAAALDSLRQAAAILDATGDRVQAGVVLRLTGEALALQGEPEKALEPLARGLSFSHAAGDRVGEAEALTSQARVERRLGRPREAESSLAAALPLFESARASIANPDLRASFLAARRQAYELRIDLLLDLDRGEPAAGHARQALEISEQARARSLLDLLQEARTNLREGVDPALRERWLSARERLQAKTERQLKLQSAGAPAERISAVEREIGSLLEEVEAAEAEIRRTSPRYAALVQPHPLRAEEIQALLDPDTLLLEYSLGEERSVLWVVGSGSVTAFALPPRARIEALAHQVYEELSTRSVGGEKAGRRSRDAARLELSRLLLGPVAGHLPSRLVIVPDGALHYVPFEALADPGAPAATLLKGHVVVSLPSATVLAAQRRDLGGRPPASRALAVLADPVFDRRQGGFDRLPLTRLEAESIAALVPPDQRWLALGVQANRDAVLGGELARYRIVHFATHSRIDPRLPALSGVLLSQVGEDGAPRQGLLSLEDIYNLRLDAGLVVLSGCETALGREVRGEGLVGLTQGFFQAGALRVVASLWPVQDRATAELMSHFYRAMLRDGQTPAAALRQAQLALARDRRWGDPYYWAGFILLGEWR
ncbi:MAG TPA: CHAT domain-containing tetratricopeptide repeat protein [Thermoanaerobaculia bacterium]